LEDDAAEMHAGFGCCHRGCSGIHDRPQHRACENDRRDQAEVVRELVRI
jgi:hypothetical protein